MKRICIVWNSWSGKSTLADKLSSLLHIPAYHLDTICLDDDWKWLPKEEVDKIIYPILEEETWIIDGNFLNLLPIEERFAKADTVIMLDVPRYKSLYRVIKRFIKTQFCKKEKRIGSRHTQKDKLRWSFIYWILWRYKKEARPKLHGAFEKHTHIRYIILQSPKQIQQFLSSLL